MKPILTTLLTLGLCAGPADAATWYTNTGGNMNDMTAVTGQYGWWSNPNGTGAQPSAAPASGDADTWVLQNGVRAQVPNAQPVWYGGTTLIKGLSNNTSTFATWVDRTVQDVTLEEWGGIQCQGGRTVYGDTLNVSQANTFVGNEGGGTSTLAFSTWTGSGTLRTKSVSNGNISDISGSTSAMTIQIGGTPDLSGFTGTFSIEDRATLRFLDDSFAPTFGIEIASNGTARHDLFGDVKVATLSLGGVALNPGTYTLDTTANPAAINLANVGGTDYSGYFTDNGGTLTVTSIKQSFRLTITPNASTPGNYDFAWDSRDGKLYDLVSATGLSTAPATWPVWDGRADIASGVATTTLDNVPGGGDPQRFFAVIEKDPPPLLSENFDAAGPGLPAGWVAANATTVWDVGDPTGLPNLQGDDGTNCVGTNVVAGDYADEVATVTLTSPSVAIPAGGATLSFRQYIDSDAPGDVGAIRLLDATDTEIVDGAFPVTGIDGLEEGWTSESYTLPPAAANQNVKVVFEFVTNADGSVYNGFYIDDVLVTGN